MKNIISRRLFKNASLLLSSDAIGSVFRIVGVILSARLLGPASFGILVLFQSYVNIVDRLVNFQCLNALIKFGGNHLARNDLGQFRSTAKFTLLVEICTAILGTCIAVLAAGWVGTLVDWNDAEVTLARIYSLAILFNISGTPIGILRLFNRFDYIAFQRIASALIKLAMIGIAVIRGEGLIGFFIAWFVSTIVEHLIYIVLAIRIMRIEKVPNLFDARVSKQWILDSGILRFIFFTNMQATVAMASRELDIMLVGSMLGAGAAGLYKIAKQFAQTMGKLTQPIYEMIYPELVRIWAANSRTMFVRLLLQTSAIAGLGAIVAWMCFFLFGDWILIVTVGPQFEDAYLVTVWYMFGMVIAIAGSPLSPAMLALGKPELNFYIDLLCTILYFAALVIMLDKFLLVSAGYAIVFYHLLWTVLMLRSTHRTLSIAA